MCKYCEDLWDEIKEVASSELEMNGIPIGKLETWMAYHTDDNEAVLESSLLINDNYIDVVTKIKFCPFCGCDLRKELSHA